MPVQLSREEGRVPSESSSAGKKREVLSEKKRTRQKEGNKRRGGGGGGGAQRTVPGDQPEEPHAGDGQEEGHDNPPGALVGAADDAAAEEEGDEEVQALGDDDAAGGQVQLVQGQGEEDVVGAGQDGQHRKVLVLERKGGGLGVPLLAAGAAPHAEHEKDARGHKGGHPVLRRGGARGQRGEEGRSVPIEERRTNHTCTLQSSFRLTHAVMQK